MEIYNNTYIKAAFDKGILCYLKKGLIFLNVAMKSEAYNQILSARHYSFAPFRYLRDYTKAFFYRDPSINVLFFIAISMRYFIFLH